MDMRDPRTERSTDERDLPLDPHSVNNDGGAIVKLGDASGERICDPPTAGRAIEYLTSNL